MNGKQELVRHSQEVAMTEEQALMLPAEPRESLITKLTTLPPKLYFKAVQCKSFDDVFASNQLTLDEVIQQGKSGQIRAFALVSAAIISYLDYINRRELMTDTQIAETARMICEEYGWLKIDDLTLLFRMVKMNKFGKTYNIDGQVIFGWIDEYIQQRRVANNLRLENAPKPMALPEPEMSPEQLQACQERIAATLKRAAAELKSTRKPKAKELTTEQKVSRIRLRIINENMHLYREDPEHAIDIINGKVFQALYEAGLPTDSVKPTEEKETSEETQNTNQ